MMLVLAYKQHAQHERCCLPVAPVLIAGHLPRLQGFVGTGKRILRSRSSSNIPQSFSAMQFAFAAFVYNRFEPVNPFSNVQVEYSKTSFIRFIPRVPNTLPRLYCGKRQAKATAGSLQPLQERGKGESITGVFMCTSILSVSNWPYPHRMRIESMVLPSWFGADRMKTVHYDGHVSLP